MQWAAEVISSVVVVVVAATGTLKTRVIRRDVNSHDASETSPRKGQAKKNILQAQRVRYASLCVCVET